MSLGLGDLKKKSGTAGKVLKSSHKAEGAAKPWSASGLSNAGRDAAMNDDGPLHAAPLFFIEVSDDSRLAKVEETLVKLEERVIRALEGPLKAAQTFFPKFFAQ